MFHKLELKKNPKTRGCTLPTPTTLNTSTATGSLIDKESANITWNNTVTAHVIYKTSVARQGVQKIFDRSLTMFDFGEC